MLFAGNLMKMFTFILILKLTILDYLLFYIRVVS